jgi:hypothetical protein
VGLKHVAVINDLINCNYLIKVLLLCAITYILLITEHNGDVSPANVCRVTPFQFHDCHLSPILILTVQKTEVLYCAVRS